MDGLPEFEPTPKEALSAINGASLSVALAAIVCTRARRLLSTAESALAMSMEVVRADTRCLDENLLAARGHPGAIECAARLRHHLEDSVLAGRDKSPDDFSIRCAPAVLGAAWEALEYATKIVERELNGACDNPLIFADGIGEGGNFHGAPIGLVLDHLKVALTQVASLSERRTYRLTYGTRHTWGWPRDDLPSFLLEGTGLNSGFMIAQYTAASLVSECKGLAHPASVDSIPTGQHHEDHVSMAPIAARGALAITDALAEVLSIEALVAAQGLDFRREGVFVNAEGELDRGQPSPLSPRVSEFLETIRGVVPRWRDDRVMHPDQQATAQLVRRGSLCDEDPTWV